jgi:hypothetical protein
MSKAIRSFVSFNAAACAKAFNVFAQIEAQSDLWAEELAAAGIVGPDIKAYAVAYVAEKSGKSPKPSQRGGLTFEKGTTEYNRVEYLVRVASGKAAEKAAKRSSGKTDPVAKLLAAYAKLSAGEKRSFKAQI